jgi:hypothetical protein
MKVLWEVEFTAEFGTWWDQLVEAEQVKVGAVVRLLEAFGPDLPFPISSGVKGSRHSHMRELRIQARGSPLRILYAFDPRRVAILLLGGNKRGESRWYEINVPRADKLYAEHTEQLKKEARKKARRESTKDG